MTIRKSVDTRYHKSEHERKYGAKREPTLMLGNSKRKSVDIEQEIAKVPHWVKVLIEQKERLQVLEEVKVWFQNYVKSFNDKGDYDIDVDEMLTKFFELELFKKEKFGVKKEMKQTTILFPIKPVLGGVVHINGKKKEILTIALKPKNGFLELVIEG